MEKLNPNPKCLRDDWFFDSRTKKLLKIEKLEKNNKILQKMIDRNNDKINEIKKQLDKKHKKRFII